MSGITEKGYKGKIDFFKHVSSGVTLALLGMDDYTPDEYILLGSVEVDVEFTTDTRQAEIEALEKQKQEVRAELAAKLATIDDRISKLMALPGGPSDD